MNSLAGNVTSLNYGGDKEALLEMRAAGILYDMQNRIEEVKPVESKPEGIETMTKLMKRIKRLDRQSEKINQPMFYGYGIDPQLNTDSIDAKAGDATDSSMLMGLG